MDDKLIIRSSSTEFFDRIDKIKLWITDYADNRNYTKMKSLKYKVIKETKA